MRNEARDGSPERQLTFAILGARSPPAQRPEVIATAWSRRSRNSNPGANAVLDAGCSSAGWGLIPRKTTAGSGKSSPSLLGSTKGPCRAGQVRIQPLLAVDAGSETSAALHADHLRALADQTQDTLFQRKTIDRAVIID